MRLVEIFNEETMPGKRFKADAAITAESLYRHDLDSSHVFQQVKLKLRQQLAAAIVDKYFTMEDVRIYDAIYVRGDVLVMTVEEFKAAAIEAYKKGVRRGHTASDMLL